MANRKQWRMISQEEKTRVLNAFDAGEKRNKIIRQYRITASQLYRIIRDAAKQKLYIK